MMFISGSLFEWPACSETVDPAIPRQYSGIACGPACAEIVIARDGVKQQLFSYVPYDAKNLAVHMSLFDKGWLPLLTERGSEEADIAVLCSEGLWISEHRRPGEMGHFVVVSQLFGHEIEVLDPFDQTRCKLLLTEFIKTWSGVSIAKV